MHVTCSSSALRRVLRAASALARVRPDLLVRAHLSTETAALVVTTSTPDHLICLIARLPASVAEHGQVHLPALRLSQALDALPRPAIGDALTLARVEVPPAAPADPPITPLRAGLALQLEQRWSGGHSQSRLRLLPPPPMDAAKPQAPETGGCALGTARPRSLRAALAPCLWLAHQRVESLPQTPEMNHALVLVQVAAGLVQWTAATHHLLASQQLAWWTCEEGVAPRRILFDEQALRALVLVLAEVQEPVSLSLHTADDGAARLLVESVQHRVKLTLVLRASHGPLPLAWESRLQQAAQRELLVPRTLLRQALASFTTVAAQTQQVWLQVREHQLLLASQEPAITARRAVALAQPVEDLAPVLLHLTSFARSVRALQGSTLRLEWGRFPRAIRPPNPPAYDWVRMGSLDGTSRLLMTTSALVPASSAHLEAATARAA